MTSGRPGRLQRARALLWKAEDGLLAALLLALVLLASFQVLQRWLFADGWSGAEAASRLLVLWLAVLGALAATREGRHVAIDALQQLLPSAGRHLLWALGQGFAALFCAAVAWFAVELVALEREAPVLLFAGLSSWVAMLVLPLAFGLMAVRFALSALLLPPPLARQ
jgi:TRAP-type C4-dicarboxylate transport system permease small subunit